METDASIEVATDTEGDLTSLLAMVENAVSESDDRLIQQPIRNAFFNHFNIFRIYKYRCPLCSFSDELAMFVTNHILDAHPKWKEDLDGKAGLDKKKIC